MVDFDSNCKQFGLVVWKSTKMQGNDLLCEKIHRDVMTSSKQWIIYRFYESSNQKPQVILGTKSKGITEFRQNYLD